MPCTPDADIATLAAPLDSVAELLDPNVVKVVTDARGRALYFSRAPIPWERDGAAAGTRRQTQLRRCAAPPRPLCVPRRRAAAPGALPPSPLEQLEKLEQLRALEHGMDIRVARAQVPPGADVNTAEDLSLVAALLQAGR